MIIQLQELVEQVQSAELADYSSHECSQKAYEQEAVSQALHAANTYCKTCIANSQLLLSCSHNMHSCIAYAEICTFSNGMLPI